MRLSRPTVRVGTLGGSMEKSLSLNTAIPIMAPSRIESPLMIQPNTPPMVMVPALTIKNRNRESAGSNWNRAMPPPAMAASSMIRVALALAGAERCQPEVVKWLIHGYTNATTGAHHRVLGRSSASMAVTRVRVTKR